MSKNKIYTPKIEIKYIVKEDDKIVFETYDEDELDKYVYEKYDEFAHEFMMDGGSGYLCDKGVYLEIIEQIIQGE